MLISRLYGFFGKRLEFGVWSLIPLHFFLYGSQPQQPSLNKQICLPILFGYRALSKASVHLAQLPFDKSRSTSSSASGFSPWTAYLHPLMQCVVVVLCQERGCASQDVVVWGRRGLEYVSDVCQWDGWALKGFDGSARGPSIRELQKIDDDIRGLDV